MLFSLKENQQKCQDNYSINGNETAEAILYTFVSSSLKKTMCKYFFSMSEDRIISIGFYKIIDRRLLKNVKFDDGDTKMTKKHWRSSSFSNELLKRETIYWQRWNWFLKNLFDDDFIFSLLRNDVGSFSRLAERRITRRCPKKIDSIKIIWPCNCDKFVDRSFVSNIFHQFSSKWRIFMEMKLSQLHHCQTSKFNWTLNFDTTDFHQVCQY